MIPEAYWKLLWRWWWLIGGLFVAGALGAYVLANAQVAYQSVAVLDVTRVYRADGSISYDELERRLQAVRWAEELEEPWVTERLGGELRARGIEIKPNDGLMIDVSAPSGSKDPTGAPIIKIKVVHPNGETAQRVAEVASQVYVGYVTERHEQFLAQKRTDVLAQTSWLEEDLRGVLERQRQALSEESAVIQTAIRGLLEAHERLLGELGVLLNEYRQQIGAAAGNTGVPPDGQVVNDTLSSLSSEVEGVAEEWRSRLRPSLAVLYATEAKPEFQLAASQDRVLRAKYETALNLLASLGRTSEVSIVEVLEDGTRPDYVSTLGLRSRYLMVAGGGFGLVIGWLLANLGEYLTLQRVRRKAVATDGVDVPYREPQQSGA